VAQQAAVAAQQAQINQLSAANALLRADLTAVNKTSTVVRTCSCPHDSLWQVHWRLRRPRSQPSRRKSTNCPLPTRCCEQT
jgi:hypothetical protein